VTPHRAATLACLARLTDQCQRIRESCACVYVFMYLGILCLCMYVCMLRSVSHLTAPPYARLLQLGHDDVGTGVHSKHTCTHTHAHIHRLLSDAGEADCHSAVLTMPRRLLDQASHRAEPTRRLVCGQVSVRTCCAGYCKRKHLAACRQVRKEIYFIRTMATVLCLVRLLLVSLSCSSA
jgi:hypothetical protein